MTGRSLDHCRILVVEDEYMLADELSRELQNAGATVIGPVPSIKGARALLDDQELPDGAILDVNLGGEPVFPLADSLIERHVPLIFTTGYDAAALPSRFAHFSRCEKPIEIRSVMAALHKAIHP
jgi:DNA-binding response OmpR family regulator